MIIKSFKPVVASKENAVVEVVMVTVMTSLVSASVAVTVYSSEFNAVSSLKDTEASRLLKAGSFPKDTQTSLLTRYYNLFFIFNENKLD